MPVTIYDISKKAGISASTVSRALTNSPLVNPETRERILKIAIELGYHPNSMARNLRTGKSNSAAFITDNLASPIASIMAAGAESWLRERGWTLFVGQGGVNFGEAQSFLSLYKQGHIAGIILAGTWVRIFDDAWLPPEVPAVCAYCFSASGCLPTVLPDDLGGAYQATRHLLDQGFRRIAMMDGIRTWHASQERLRGYQKALAEAGLSFEPELVRYADWRIEGGYHYTKELLELDSPPDALFAANDFMAAGAIQAAQELGFNIPRQFGIIGFDNREITQVTQPKLSSIRLPLYEIGQAAARSFLNLFEPASSEDLNKIAIPNHDPLWVECQPIIRGTSTVNIPVQRDRFDSF